MPSNPSLPARKAGGKRVPASVGNNRNLPILNASEIELEDGTKIPIKIPPGMPPHQAQALIAYLQANPDQAKQYLVQAQLMAQTPGLAQAFAGMQSSMTPEMGEKFSVLKDDPEFKEMFEDMAKNGPGAFKKYWDDMEMMAKISAKMRKLELEKNGQNPDAPPAPAKKVQNLHDAAKFGNIDAANNFIEDGVDVNMKNEKGVTALGVAVGFNKSEMIKFLISKGADIELPDSKGNTVMHYAAGYGRKEIAEILIEAGANLTAENDAKQKPMDVAKMNKEKQMVDFIRDRINAQLFPEDQ